jgi:UDP-N-acetylglucosamine 2-epimerase (non-hydrolysing)
MAPLIAVIIKHPHMSHRLIATGQQDSLFDDAIAHFGIAVDSHLGHHPGGEAGNQCEQIEAAVAKAFETNVPDLVLVQGDTNTAIAAARAAARSHLLIGHVEAGLRSHNPDRPFPEEANRIEIAKLASLHFAPSPGAAANLAKEQASGEIYVTGNPGIDAIFAYKQPAKTSRSGILVTCHRRENFGTPLASICEALIAISSETSETMMIPVHPNPNVSQPIFAALENRPRIKLVEPLPYHEMISAVQQSLLVISDSGGLQEECAALGVPLLVLREETERPEVIENGNAILVGSNPSLICNEALRLLSDNNHYACMSQPSFPYGKGDAALRIVDAIAQHFGINGHDVRSK